MSNGVPVYFDEMRLRVARSHNLRVLAILPLLGLPLVISILLHLHGPLVSALTLVGMAVTLIAGMLIITRLDNRQCIHIGFICPICDGPLYDGRSNALSNKGSCPCCKKLILSKLNKAQGRTKPRNH